ncbi:MAG: hypothetical protein KC491_01210 [Dehalococcoidia bacterium]|nr:hypothetical protein [Dehalococcoidia bacterium]
MRTVVLVPYRPDGGPRDRIWAYLKQHVWQGKTVLVGEHRDGPFNRAKALNEAADCDWDVAVIADADTWVPARQFDQAVYTARVTGKLVAAFNAVVELDKPATTAILTGRHTLTDSHTCERIRLRDTETQSCMLAVTRQLWDCIGGFDERFCGWGAEDQAFWHAATLLGGEPGRINGNAYHLWHPPSRQKFRGPEYRRNLQLWHRYQQSRTEQELRCLQSASSPTPAGTSRPGH